MRPERSRSLAVATGRETQSIHSSRAANDSLVK